MKVNLVAIQAKMELGDYRDAAAFKRKVALLMIRAMREVDPALPTLVAYPEYLGMYLSFVPHFWDELKNETNMWRGVDRIVAKHSARLDEALRHDPRKAAQRLLFIDSAIETERAYMDAFSALAREHGAYLAAGSLCVPELDESPHRGGRFVHDDSKVYNQSYLFSPRGLCLKRVKKVNVPPGENLLIDGGPRSELVPVDTSIGRIGTLLCFDGYHHSLVEQYDSLGTDLLVQPLYFDGPQLRFDGSGKIVPQPWDFISMIQGRENIQYVIAPFLVGSVFEDKRAEGMSFIARNTGRAGAPWADAIVARTTDAFSEAIVAAIVEVAGR